LENAVAGLLVLVGIINLLPVIGALGSEKLSSLYGVPIHETNLVILMRHRALLFGLIGAFMIYAAFRPLFQPLAFVAGFFSMLSFVVLAGVTGVYNRAIRKVIVVDILGSVALAAAGLLYALKAH